MDEAGFSTLPARRTTWGTVGRTPVVKIAGRGWKKISVAAALAVSPGGRGGRRIRQFFRMYEQDIDGPCFAGFVRELLRSVRGRIVLIWDGLAVHRAPAVKTLLAKRPRVEVHRLPSYAPELNPVEPMWAMPRAWACAGTCPPTRSTWRSRPAACSTRSPRRNASSGASSRQHH